MVTQLRQKQRNLITKDEPAPIIIALIVVIVAVISLGWAIFDMVLRLGKQVYSQIISRIK